MKSPISKIFGAAVALLACVAVEKSASAQLACNINVPAGTPLSAYVTVYPNIVLSEGAGQQLISWFIVDVTLPGSGANPPIPDGEYPTWCVDEADSIDGTNGTQLPYTIPGELLSGELFSTCDTNLNNELPPGHPDTLVSPTNWLAVDYILNNHNGYFYWDVQAAINTFVGSAVGTPNPSCGGLYTTQTPDGNECGALYPTFNPVNVATLVSTAVAAVAAGWVPGPGDVVGVIFVSSVNQTGYVAPFNQFIVLEVPYCPPVTLTNLPGSPGGSFLGCNPTNIPSDVTVTNGVTLISCCGLLSLGATHADSSSGCTVTRTFTITAIDTCSNTVSSNVVYSWTTNTSPPTFTSVPAGGPLGCNPTTIPTVTPANVQAAASCGETPTITVNCQQSTSGCTVTKTYTITATDACNNSATTNVTYTWTADTSTPSLSVTPGGNLGCNPTTLPTAPQYTASDTCGNVATTVTPSDSVSGCVHTRVFMVVATDSCSGNSATGSATYTWTIDATTPSLTVTPGTSLGCNPTVLPTAPIYTTSDTCGNVTPTVSSSDSVSGCVHTRVFTVVAADSCSGNSATGHATYTWTVDATTPSLSVTPGNNLGCNPTTLPTAPQYTASDTCGNVTTTVTPVNSISGCVYTRVFNIVATDSCSGNSATGSATYTWTVNTTPPTINKLPTGGYVGCGSGSAPTVSTVTNGVTATGQCGSATLSVSSKDTTNGCVGTRTFTFTAVDGCNNTTTETVEYTWTAGGGITVICPSNVVIVTNMCQMYCTFAPCDWGCACAGCNNNNNNWWGSNWGNNSWGWGNNGGWGINYYWWQNYNNCWWQNWCSTNSSSQCWPNWTNWWSSCGNASQCSNIWSRLGSNQTNCWSGTWCNNQSGNWWSAWNCGNQGNQWVPCNGNNPSDTLTNCFRSVYTNGYVCVGLPNSGNCFTFTSPSGIQTCLNWGGSCAPLTCSATNPATCNSGTFCAQVLALRLNCDFGDSGCEGVVGRCGDLVLNCPSSPCNGKKVRDILGICNTALGCGSCPSGCSVQYLCGLCSNINNCFRGCQPSGWCTNLSSVYIPPVSQTGTATVADACTPNPSLTNYDTVVSAGCPGNYIIEREWVAVDACGNSNYCTQLITIGQTNSSSISGVVVLACTGDTNLSNNEGLSGVTVSLKNSSGAVIATGTTDTNGDYSFADVALGTYTVVVTPPSGLTETYPSTSGNSATVTLTACENGTANFAYIGSTPGVQFIKTGPATMPCSGVITYTFAVTNTGNSCETLTVVDPLLGGTIFSQTSVPPGAGYQFTTNYKAASTTCMLTNTAWGIGTAPNGKSVTNTSTVVTCVTTKCVTNSICCSFNSQNPNDGWLWCNAHLNCNPGKACTIYCQNASITLTCNDGNTYNFPIPNCQVNFTNCSSGSCSFNGSSWQTSLPCNGDSQIFLTGCGIPWQSDFANCRSACVTGTFSCSTPGVNCNWQWSCANYNCNLGNCGSVNVKACYQTQCGYNNTDCAGTPENCKSSCQGGGCGYGGSNYCGSWSSTGSFTCN